MEMEWVLEESLISSMIKQKVIIIYIFSLTMKRCYKKRGWLEVIHIVKDLDIAHINFRGRQQTDGDGMKTITQILLPSAL